MPPFERPTFDFTYDLAREREALIRWRDTAPGRAIPAKQDGQFLLGSWNIANLGDEAQVRTDDDCALMAEILSWFDVVAVQEVKEDLTDLRRVMSFLPHGYETVFTDLGGNRERMVYVYDAAQVQRMELAGEIAIPVASHRHIKLPGIEQKFRGFDRNPFAVAFDRDGFVLTVTNAHLYFGSSAKRSINRRALETYALGRWADLRQKSEVAYSPNVAVIGDLNMPKAEVGDEIFDALTARGLALPEHQTRLGTTLTEDKHYDQLAFFPGGAGAAFERSGVFDFDGALFADLWAARTPAEFEAYVRYHLSDHRPIWAVFRA